MTTEEKHKINVWIPESLWKQIGSLGYESPTEATKAAFEALVLQETKGSNQEALGSSQEDFRKLQEEIGRYQEKVKDLEARPDPVNYAQLQAKYEGLQEIIREKDKSIERLENDLKKADLDKEDLKAVYNNYFLQVQTLINQKAIGTGSTKEAIRKKQEETGSNQEENRKFQEDSPAIKKNPDIEPENKPEVKQEDKNHWKEKEATIEKTCKNCLQPFFAKNPKNEYCSPKCRTAYNRKQKQFN